jgi:predicted enzyme related to lactoylglutathione lyase
MHRSRLSSILIDCASSDYERGIAFWSRALGKEGMREDDRYTTFRGNVGGAGGLLLGLQRVPPAERAIHLDIETDDVAAEVSRLEALGARVKTRFEKHVVMTSPTDHAFCVVPVFRKDFPEGATEWGGNS